MKVESSTLDFWTTPREVNTNVDVHVPASSLHGFISHLNNTEIDYKVLIQDIGMLIRQENKPNRRARDTTFDVNSYHKVTEIESFLKEITEKRKNITLEKLGTSHEGRYIYGIKFASGMKISEKWEKILDTFDMYILPMMNPDGYSYSWRKNRLWRKTRSQTKIPKCYGVDGNRNWDVSWGKFATSQRPCDNHYGGEKAFSEKETTIMKKKILSTNSSIAIFLSVHSYGQQVILSDSISNNKSSDYDILVSGSSLDWVYEVAGIRNSFAIELRDDGQKGFLVPKSEISDTAEELLAGIQAIAENTS
ncbi:Carboxypeptidase A1 [Nymphon striatum]|nr:Carboxypeptidase A1 [Nymphon striatum]